MIQNVNAGQQRQNFGMALNVGKSMEFLPVAKKATEVDSIVSSLVRIAHNQKSNGIQDLCVELRSNKDIVAFTQHRSGGKGIFSQTQGPGPLVEVPIKRGFFAKLIHGKDYEQIEEFSQRMAKDFENKSTIDSLVGKGE